MKMPGGTNVKQYLGAKFMVSRNAWEVIAEWSQEITRMSCNNHPNSTPTSHSGYSAYCLCSPGHCCEAKDYISGHRCVIK